MEKVNDGRIHGVKELGDYARTYAPNGRWSDAWHLFKGNFGKIVIINLLILVFMIHSTAVIYIGNIYTAGLGSVYPFAANAGLGFFAAPSVVGLPESVYLSSDLMFYALLIATGFIAALGVSGGAYSMRKLINTNGEFYVKNFFRGIKVGYFRVLPPVIVFLAFLFGSVIVSDWAAMYIALGGGAGGAITAKVFMIIAAVIVGIICMWFIAVGVSFRLSAGKFVRYTFKMMTGSLLQTVIMLGVALVPVWLLLIFKNVSFMLVLTIALLIVLGLSYIFLCWMSFAQWAFDLYVVPEAVKEKQAEKAKKTPGQLAEETADERKRLAMELLAAGKSELIGRPVKPVSDVRAVKPLGAAYGRADIGRVTAERSALKDELAAYTEKHISDPEYAEYNKMFAEREKALADDGKKGRKKKISSDNLLH